MASMQSAIVIISALAHLVASHGGLANYTVGDTWYRGYDPTLPLEDQQNSTWLTQRIWTSIDPIFSVHDPGLACNNPGTSPRSYIPIRAGDVLTAVYWYWLHPVGPMSVWLADCSTASPDGTCEAANPNELEFVKIDERGLLNGSVPEGVWYQRAFQNWDGSPDLWDVRIPETVRPGLYVVRHEILSLHIENRPQFYPECAHLNISGSGSAVPPKELRVRFPGGYAEDDPSININIYTDEMKNTTNYTIPGPPVWDGLSNKYCSEC